MMVEMLKLLKVGITKLSAKRTQETKKEMEVIVYWKITPLETLVDQEGWKVSCFKGMYVAIFLALIQVIWLKGITLTYVAKK
jgi:hypothetical protein